MVNLSALLLLACVGLAYSPYSTCFYTQKIIIANSTYFSYQLGGYGYTVTWNQPQLSITKSAYTLVAYRSMLGNQQISFNASLTSLTSTGAIFIFDPQVSSSISYIEFSMVLLKSCPGYIDLIFVCNMVITQNTRLINLTSLQEFETMNLTQTFTADKLNYRIATFISAFYIVQIGSLINLTVQHADITSGYPYSWIYIHSSTLFNNVITKIWFTFMVMYVPSFPYQLSTYAKIYQINPTSTFPSTIGPLPIHPNYGIPSEFSSQLGEKCIISISTLLVYSSVTTSQITYLDTGNVSAANISSVQCPLCFTARFQSFCMQTCTGSNFSTVYNPEKCGMCWDHFPNCQTCNYQYLTYVFICLSCFPNYFLLTSANTCYSLCPPGYYNNIVTLLCTTCKSICYTCEDGDSCLSCKTGWPIENICTTVEGCLEFTSPSNCTRCSSIGKYELIASSCYCIPGYYLVNHYCTDIIGCAGATLSRNKTICHLCDTIKGFLFSNGTCVCKEGHSLFGTQCKETCGDGRIFTDQCDDGNSVSGDGCSKYCRIEDDYHCVQVSQQQPTKCVYAKSDIALSLSQIQKTELKNQGIFVFKITPGISNLAKLDYKKDVAFYCNQSTSIHSTYYSDGQLTLLVDYYQDLQGIMATLHLTLESEYFVQQNTTISFNMTSNGSKLLVSDKVDLLQLVKKMIAGKSIAAFVTFVLSWFVHKMIGIELVFPLQIVYFTHLINRHYSPEYGLLKYLGFTSWNLFSVTDGTSNIGSARGNVSFSKEDQELTLLLVTSCILLASTFFAVIRGIQIMCGKRFSSSKVSHLHNAAIRLYSNFLFPLTIGFVPAFYLVSTTYLLHKDSSSFPYVIICTFCFMTILASLIFFFEWKFLFVQQQTKIIYGGMPLCCIKLIPVYLTFILTTVMLLSYGFLYVDFSPSLAILMSQGVLLLWIIVRQPYESLIHNVGAIVNTFPSLFFLGLDVARDHYPPLTKQEGEISMIFGIFCIEALSILMSISRILYELWRRLMLPKKQQSKVQNEAGQRQQQLLDKTANAVSNIGEIDIAFFEKIRKDNVSLHKEQKDKAEAVVTSFPHYSQKNEAEMKKKIRERYGEIVQVIKQKRKKMILSFINYIFSFLIILCKNIYMI